MKTAKQILSDITGYSVDELTERNTEPLLQAEDCLTAMYCFLAQQQENGVEQSDSNCNIPDVIKSVCEICGKPALENNLCYEHLVCNVPKPPQQTDL